MSTTSNPLPLTETLAPGDQDELARDIHRAYESDTPIYPLGGETSLDYGLAAEAPGWGISSSSLQRVVDYPARDMTITVEAGLTMTALAECLAEHRQWLPLDAAQADRATVGGVMATNFSGPRRYGQGTMRDHVIGVQAVDGRGRLFKGGGRVVKNVAGYDFCRLLTGSMGTLAVITQVTLRVKPRPESSALLACDVADMAQAETLLAALVDFPAVPSAIELLAGPAWRDDEALGPIGSGAAARLVVGLEGTRPEVDWMLKQLPRQWSERGVTPSQAVGGFAAEGLWRRLTEFAAEESPLVLKFNVLPSQVCRIVERCLAIDAQCSIQAHAGNGIVVARFAEFSPADVTGRLVGELQPVAIRAGGGVVVYSSQWPEAMSLQATWQPEGAAVAVMRRVRDQFDPKGLLNPGRFVYGMS